MRHDRDLDWSVADDEAFAQADPEPTPPAPRGPAWWRGLVRWQTAVVALAAVAVVAAGLGLDRWRQQHVLIDAVQAVVTAEDEARLAGDREALLALWRLYDPSLVRHNADPALTFTRVTDLRTDLIAAPEPGRVVHVERLEADLVRASVARTFTSWVAIVPETNVIWLETQFYRFVDGGWLRVELARDRFDATLRHAGRWVDWEYGPLDSAYVATWAPEIDALIEGACRQVDCPPETRIRLALVARGPETYQAGQGQSWLHAALTSGSVTRGFVRLTTPTRRGLPGDPVSLEAERQTLGTRALAALHLMLRPTDGQPWAPSRAIALALWIRLADRLDLEPATPSRWLLPDPGAPDLDALAGDPPLYDPARQVARLQVFINRLLRDQDPAAEARMLSALDMASDAESWLVAGLGLTPEAAREQLQRAAEPLRLPLTVEGEFAYAVSCGDGIRLASLGDATVIALTEPGLVVPDFAPTWSPDGQRLATYSGLVYDFVRREVFSVASPAWQAYSLVWLDPTTLAYFGHFENGQPGVQANVIDLDQPTAVRVIAGVMGFVPSPDGQWLAVLGGGDGPDVQIGLVPNRDPYTDVAWIGPGSSPLWSPDSRRLVFFTYPNGSGDNPTVHGVEIEAAGPGTPRPLADLQTAFRPEGTGDMDAWMFTGSGQSLTFRYSAAPDRAQAGARVRQYGARLDLDTGQLSIRRWPEDEPTDVWPIQGLGLVEIRPDLNRLTVRDQIDGFPLRSVAFDLTSGFATRVSGSSTELLFTAYPQSYVWRDPLDPSSQPEPLAVPCLFPVARPGDR